MDIQPLGRWGTLLAEFFLPPACAGCARHLPRSDLGGANARRICPECRTRLRSLPHPRCPRCHAPRATGHGPDRPCTECQEWPPIIRGARSAVVLAPPADGLVYALKYGGWPELAGEMAERMVTECFPLPGVSRNAPVVPVPTTPSRLRARGYNQARVLAAEVARQTGGALVDGLHRSGDGRSQISLQPGERRSNVEAAFGFDEEAREAVGNREVLLVDDVLTTGATVAAAATALGEGGVAAVAILTFARALPDRVPRPM